ncbi:pyruvate carboxylase subunit B [Bradyrhizobium sp. B097]|uniref:pyruvate carboxylase subunit B n=1 Tax=Bradyrhizobium sp. B097 TaxID=3140244 RepID=UPI0031835246
MVGIVDETLRDGPQSLWATRMSTGSMLGATDTIGGSGFRKVCVTSGAAFETAVKFLAENPWDRLRLLQTYMPNMSLDVLVRSRNLFGWSHYSDDVVQLVFRCLRDVGVEWVKIFDGLNDMRNIEAHFRIARSLGLKSSGIIAFTESPVHTDEYFVKKARELVSYDVDSITLGDASGILTGPRAKSLLAALRSAVGPGVPIEFVAHHTMGLAHASYREALIAGVDTVATASTPLANGESVPSTLDVMKIAEELGLDTGLDREAVRCTDDYFYWVAHIENRAVAGPFAFDAERYRKFIEHQIPGGMMSNFRNQLLELGLLSRLDEVLEEAGRIRRELGYPIMVTPFSQFVGVQATMNVIQRERYRTIPQELRLYVMGRYGAAPAPIDAEVLDRVLGGRTLEEHSAPEVAFERPMLEEFRRDAGPFRSDEELLLHMFYGREHVEALPARGTDQYTRPFVDRPLVALVKELLKEPRLRSVRVQKKSFKLDMTFASESEAGNEQ